MNLLEVFQQDATKTLKNFTHIPHALLHCLCTPLLLRHHENRHSPKIKYLHPEEQDGSLPSVLDRKTN